MLVLICGVLQVFLFGFVMCDWVEIPQSSRKSYLVTPYSPYIYTPSLVFTSTTTEHYGTMQPLSKPKISKPELKKSITKVPDAVLRKTTTEMPFVKSTRKSLIKHGHINQINTTSEDSPLEHPHYQSNISKNEKLKFIPTTPTSISSEMPVQKLSNKNFQVENEEDEFEEDDEYVQVYDDDEDHYTDNNEDFNDDGGEHDGDVALNPSDIGEDNADDGFDDDYYDEDEYEDEPPVNEPKGNVHYQTTESTNSNGFSYANFLPYLKNIQSTLIRNTHTDTVSNKVSFLTDIKNRLLYAIQSRISSIWEPRKKRQTRATRGDMWDSWEKGGDHGMEFPSNEGALLTLGFLTFAVFLIKCILKLIHAIKGKHGDKGTYQIIIQNGTAAVTPPTVNTFRFKRDIVDLEIAKLMSNIENYKPH